MNFPRITGLPKRLLVGALRCAVGSFAIVGVVHGHLWILIAVGIYLLWRLFVGPLLSGLFPP